MTRRGALVVSIAALFVAGGCQAQSGSASTPTAHGSASGGPDGSAAAPTTSSTPSVEPATITVAASDGAGPIKPNDRVRISAAGGTLDSVTVTSGTGDKLPGALKDGVWTSSANMAPATTYSVATTTTRTDGSQQQDTKTFQTLTPKTIATYHVLYDGVTLGVGAPVTIQFDTPVETKAMRAEIEKHSVVTTNPKVVGSWGWLDSRQLMWRPENFWQPGTTVALKADLTGLPTGADKWIGRSATGTFRIGASTISTVDIANHSMTVTQNGRVLRTVPVSTGKSSDPRFVTRSGTKVVIERKGDITMDSETVGIKKGDPNYYKVETKYNVRVTWTGEFLHSAPWSVGAQGNANVTHGCTNLSPANAEWFFNLSKVGDVVKFTGSDRVFQPTEGIGVWEYSYKDWTKQSALSA